MNPLKPGYLRGFTQMSRSWYRRSATSRKPHDYIDEVTFGIYRKDGAGCTGEMTMEWRTLAGEPAAQLKAFHDSWVALVSFTDLLARMAALEDSSPSPDEFCTMLRECGFTDLTKTQDPYAS